MIMMMMTNEWRYEYVMCSPFFLMVDVSPFPPSTVGLASVPETRERTKYEYKRRSNVEGKRTLHVISTQRGTKCILFTMGSTLDTVILIFLLCLTRFSCVNRKNWRRARNWKSPWTGKSTMVMRYPLLCRTLWLVGVANLLHLAELTRACTAATGSYIPGKREL